MSQLSTDTKVVYCAVYYDGGNNYINESIDFDTEEIAIVNAQFYIAEEIEQNGQYLYARIEKRIVPIYK